MFDEFSRVMKYCEGKLHEWNENSGITCGANGVMSNIISRNNVPA